MDGVGATWLDAELACAIAIVSAVAKPQREVWVGRSTMQMAMVQAVAPEFADRQAAKMWESQLDRSIEPASPGNLYYVDEDDPSIDGPLVSRTKPPRNDFVTSRSRDAVAVVLTLASAAGTAATLAPLILVIGLQLFEKK